MNNKRPNDDAWLAWLTILNNCRKPKPATLEPEQPNDERRAVDIEIGPFGLPNYDPETRMFSEISMGSDGATNYRQWPTPVDEFRILSCGTVIYEHINGTGQWFGSERTRREREAKCEQSTQSAQSA